MARRNFGMTDDDLANSLFGSTPGGSSGNLVSTNKKPAKPPAGVMGVAPTQVMSTSPKQAKRAAKKADRQEFLDNFMTGMTAGNAADTKFSSGDKKSLKHAIKNSGNDNISSWDIEGQGGVRKLKKGIKGSGMTAGAGVQKYWKKTNDGFYNPKTDTAPVNATWNKKAGEWEQNQTEAPSSPAEQPTVDNTSGNSNKNKPTKQQKANRFLKNFDTSKYGGKGVNLQDINALREGPKGGKGLGDKRIANWAQNQEKKGNKIGGIAKVELGLSGLKDVKNLKNFKADPILGKKKNEGKTTLSRGHIKFLLDSGHSKKDVYNLAQERGARGGHAEKWMNNFANNHPGVTGGKGPGKGPGKGIGQGSGQGGGQGRSQGGKKSWKDNSINDSFNPDNSINDSFNPDNSINDSFNPDNSINDSFNPEVSNSGNMDASGNTGNFNNFYNKGTTIYQGGPGDNGGWLGNKMSQDMAIDDIRDISASNAGYGLRNTNAALHAAKLNNPWDRNTTAEAIGGAMSYMDNMAMMHNEDLWGPSGHKPAAWKQPKSTNRELSEYDLPKKGWL